MNNFCVPRLPYGTMALGIIFWGMSASSLTAAELFNSNLENKLAELVTTPGGPPGALVLIQRGNQVNFYTAGVAELQSGREIAATDHMRIASVSKAFSGAASLSLVEQGLLSLDDTIAEILPSLPTAWGEVTLRQLLNHTSGLPDFSTNQAFLARLAQSLTEPIPPRELLDFVAADPLQFEPGSQYNYSNSDNVSVGLMVEAVTGKSYENVLQEIVFAPLGLTQTSLPVGAQLPTPFIHGYDVQQGATEDISEAIAAGWTWASGGIVSTPSDLNRFIRGYAGGQLFGSAIQAEQFDFVPGGSSQPPGPGVNAAGLGIFRYQTRCGTVYGHTGNFPGYTQFIAATPDGLNSVVVSANTQISPTLAPDIFPQLREIDEEAVCAALAPVPESSPTIPVVGLGLWGLFLAYNTTRRLEGRREN